MKNNSNKITKLELIAIEILKAHLSKYQFSGDLASKDFIKDSTVYKEEVSVRHGKMLAILYKSILKELQSNTITEKGFDFMEDTSIGRRLKSYENETL